VTRPHVAPAALMAAGLVALLALMASGQEPPTDGQAPPETIRTATGAEMALLPGGSYEMGSADGRADEAPVHRVFVDSFYIDVCEVTQQQYTMLVPDNPSHFEGGKRPVENVTREAVVTYCIERSRAEGLEPCYDEDTRECDFTAAGYRVPTEAEWEYACRAGSTGAYCFGDDAAELADCAWYEDNADGETHAVGGKLANAFGLFDMHGNVAEWCEDLYDPRYYEHSEESNPHGADDTGQYVLRGGAWNATADECRSAYRFGDDAGFQDPCFRGEHIGFRCVRRAEPAE
jgi:formylglycine-generating enzyme required for sulfatase activity